MNCLIIDDNNKTTNRLQQLLEMNPAVGQVHKALLPYMVRSLLACEAIDVIFIRIRLWDFRQFENIGQKPMIVFFSGGKDKLTGHPERCVQYYLRQPFNGTELSLLIKKMNFEKFTEPPVYLFIRFEGKFHKILFSTIELIERKEKGYLMFYFSFGKQLIPGTLTQWLQKLPEGKFIRPCDTLIMPFTELPKIKNDNYEYKGKQFQLTYHFAVAAKKEMERSSAYALQHQNS